MMNGRILDPAEGGSSRKRGASIRERPSWAPKARELKSIKPFFSVAKTDPAWRREESKKSESGQAGFGRTDLSGKT
jgi:hypothetical protein